MHKSVLALTVLAAVVGGGCSDDDDHQSPDGGVGGDGGGPGGPPFTEGVSTLSGGPEPGDLDGRRGTARFANPVNVELGPDGRVHVADFDNGKIRAVDADDGTTSTVASGLPRPFALAFAPDGTLYVSTDRDPTGMHGPMSGTIWRVNPGAGTATPIAERIGRKRGLAVLPDGRIAVSDYAHHVIQLLDPATGALTPLAGAWDAPGFADGIGDAARFSTPYDLVVLGGALVVADHANHRLRRVGLDGSVSTIAGDGAAGSADGPAGSARFNGPQGLAVTESGDLYVTDLGNHVIRRLRGGAVETIAGSGEPGFADADDLREAQFFGLEGLTAEPDGSRLYVADGNRGEAGQPFHRVRRVELR